MKCRRQLQSKPAHNTDSQALFCPTNLGALPVSANDSPYPILCGTIQLIRVYTGGVRRRILTPLLTQGLCLVQLMVLRQIAHP